MPLESSPMAQWLRRSSQGHENVLSKDLENTSSIKRYKREVHSKRYKREVHSTSV